MDYYNYDTKIIPIIHNAIDANINIYNLPIKIKNNDLQENYNLLNKSKEGIILISQRYIIETDTLFNIYLVLKNGVYYQVLFNNDKNTINYITKIL